MIQTIKKEIAAEKASAVVEVAVEEVAVEGSRS